MDRWERLLCGIAVLFVGLAAGSTQASAQESEEEEEEQRIGLDWVVFPTFKFNDDTGFAYGGQLNMVEYGEDGLQPFVWELRAKAEHSTNNRHEHSIFFEAPHLLGGGWRFLTRIDVLHIDDANYFGIGKDTRNDRAPSVYNYQLTEPRAQLYVRKNLETAWFVGLGLGYQFTLIDAPTGSLLDAQRPLGWEGGQGPQLQLSVGYDGRDNEIVPRNGYFVEAYTRGAAAPLADFSFAVLGLNQQGYIAPWSWLVFAQRVLVEQVLGDAPLYELYRVGSSPSFRGLGGVFSQRGFVEGRFLGSTRLLLNSEVRGYFPPLWGGLVFGLGAFVDASQVVDSSAAFGAGLHPSVGGEFLINWKDAIVFRIDYAVSEEGGLFYIEGRHLF